MVIASQFTEIESFNLADLNVSALDARLELTTVLPQYSGCEGDCAVHIACGIDTGCKCDQYG